MINIQKVFITNYYIKIIKEFFKDTISHLILFVIFFIVTCIKQIVFISREDK